MENDELIEQTAKTTTVTDLAMCCIAQWESLADELGKEREQTLHDMAQEICDQLLDAVEENTRDERERIAVINHVAVVTGLICAPMVDRVKFEMSCFAHGIDMMEGERP